MKKIAQGLLFFVTASIGIGGFVASQSIVSAALQKGTQSSIDKNEKLKKQLAEAEAPIVRKPVAVVRIPAPAPAAKKAENPPVWQAKSQGEYEGEIRMMLAAPFLMATRMAEYREIPDAKEKGKIVAAAKKVALQMMLERRVNSRALLYLDEHFTNIRRGTKLVVDSPVPNTSVEVAVNMNEYTEKTENFGAGWDSQTIPALLKKLQARHPISVKAAIEYAQSQSAHFPERAKAWEESVPQLVEPKAPQNASVANVRYSRRLTR